MLNKINSECETYKKNYIRTSKLIISLFFKQNLNPILKYHFQTQINFFKINFFNINFIEVNPIKI